jgi:hypothetical protein
MRWVRVESAAGARADGVVTSMIDETATTSHRRRHSYAPTVLHRLGESDVPPIMISVHIVRVMNDCFFFSYSEASGFFSSKLPFRISLLGLPGSDEASVEAELGLRASTPPLLLCWNLTAFGLAISLYWSSRPSLEVWEECAIREQ